MDEMAGESGDIAQLTKRQRQCLLLVAKGLSTKQIARSLSLSPSTVDNHLQTAIAKLGVEGRFEAARLFAETPCEIENEALSAGASKGNGHQLYAALFSLPPLGGRIVSEDRRGRIRRIVQIALLSLMAALTLILTISGVVVLLDQPQRRDAVAPRK